MTGVGPAGILERAEAKVRRQRAEAAVERFRGDEHVAVVVADLQPQAADEVSVSMRGQDCESHGRVRRRNLAVVVPFGKPRP